jgi:hypothetical protein
VSSVAHRGMVHVGMDVSKDAIVVAVLPPDRDVAEMDKILNDEESVRRLVKRLGRPSGLWPCYEAGPTGYDLHRLLTALRVARLAAYRGVSRIGGLCLAAEVFDWRRFPRARPFMSFTGLVPSENSTGNTQRRGHISRAGDSHLRGQLCEAAWSYQYRPSLGAGIRQRQADVSAATAARSWAAQVRLSNRFRQLAAHKTSAPWWPLPSPVSSPGSCGPRWSPTTEPCPSCRSPRNRRCS